MTIELTYDLEREWLAALRSDKYNQTTGTLYRESANAYCCLGVLGCVLAAKGQMTSKATAEGNIFEEVEDGKVPYNADTPYEIAMRRYGGNHPLVDWNDREQVPFNVIADRIESGQVYLERQA